MKTFTTEINFREFLSLAILLVFMAYNAKGQDPSLNWERTITEDGDQAFNGIFETSYGYLVFGNDQNDVEGDYLMVALNPEGEVLWKVRIGGPGTDLLQGVIELDDGYILAGYGGEGAGMDKTVEESGPWVVRINDTGNVLWDVALPASGWLQSIKRHNQTLYAIYSNMETVGVTEMVVFSLDLSGHLNWDLPVYTSQSVFLGDFLTLDDGLIFAASSPSGVDGMKTSDSNGGYDYWVLRINSSGDILWDKSYGGSSDDRVKRIIEFPGGYVMAGDSGSGISGDKSESSRGDADFWLVAIDENGGILWNKTVGSPGTDTTYEFFDEGDHLTVFGQGSDTPGGEKPDNSGTRFMEMWGANVSYDGEFLWARSVPGDEEDYFHSVISVPDGFLFPGGTLIQEGDYRLFKTDKQFNILWEAVALAPQEDILISVLINEGIYTLAGVSQSVAGGDKSESSIGSDIWLMQFGLPTAPEIIAVTGPVDAIRVGDEVVLDITYSAMGNAVFHIDWGDATVSEVVGDGGNIQLRHTYNLAGVYTPQMTLTDNTGEFDEYTFKHVLIYDPGAGFITGGGWYSTSHTARNRFNFVARYSKEQLRGNMQFATNGLRFTGIYPAWLIISGENIWMKVDGYINKSEKATLLMHAIDGRPDRMQVNITGKETGIVYLDGDIFSPVTQQILGSIQIHQPAVRSVKHWFDEMKIYPNPVHDVVRIHVKSENNEIIRCRILNLNGKLLLEANQVLPAGPNIIELDVGHLKLPGNMFLLQIERNGERKMIHMKRE